MKKYLLAAALVMMSSSAMADRIVTGIGEQSTKAEACSKAKNSARAQEKPGEIVEGFTRCDCEKDGGKSYEWWGCSVDAKIVKDD